MKGETFFWLDAQDAASGLETRRPGKDEYLILSTQGGIRGGDGLAGRAGPSAMVITMVGLLGSAGCVIVWPSWAILSLVSASDPVRWSGRRARAGYDGQPGVPQRCSDRPAAADPEPPTRQGVLGTGDLRQVRVRLPCWMAAGRQRPLPWCSVPAADPAAEHGEDAGKIQLAGSALRPWTDFGRMQRIQMPFL